MPPGVAAIRVLLGFPSPIGPNADFSTRQLGPFSVTRVSYFVDAGAATGSLVVSGGAAARYTRRSCRACVATWRKKSSIPAPMAVSSVLQTVA